MRHFCREPLPQHRLCPVDRDRTVTRIELSRSWLNSQRPDIDRENTRPRGTADFQAEIREHDGLRRPPRVNRDIRSPARTVLKRVPTSAMRMAVRSIGSRAARGRCQSSPSLRFEPSRRRCGPVAQREGSRAIEIAPSLARCRPEPLSFRVTPRALTSNCAARPSSGMTRAFDIGAVTLAERGVERNYVPGAFQRSVDDPAFYDGDERTTAMKDKREQHRKSGAQKRHAPPGRGVCTMTGVVRLGRGQRRAAATMSSCESRLFRRGFQSSGPSVRPDRPIACFPSGRCHVSDGRVFHSPH